MVLSMDRWKGKVAVVTGASEGIGAAIAKSLVENGLTVVGFARRKEKIEELARTLEDPSKLCSVKVDLTVEQEIVEGFQWIKENLGAVHILINNAAVVPNNALSDGDTESWKKVLDTNVLGLSIATREALKIMKENEIDGHVVHINSIAGHRVQYLEGLSMYYASKYAVTALTEVLRQELNAKNSKTKVTSISPGYVETSILATAGMDGEKIRRALKLDKGLQPEDIADAVVYVLSTPHHVQVHELTVSPVGQA